MHVPRLTVLVQKRRLERLGEVLPEVMRRSRLKRLLVAHHRLDRVLHTKHDVSLTNCQYGYENKLTVQSAPAKDSTRDLRPTTTGIAATSSANRR